jgi:tetratricopeptide (TPR) repeat protein
MKRKRTSKRPKSGASGGEQERANRDRPRRVRPATLAVAIVCLGVVGVVCYLQWDNADRAANQDGLTGSKPLAMGEPPVDAAAVLQLRGDPPQTVEELNEEALAVGELLVKTLPDRPESHAQMAFAHLQLGQEREALESWQEVLARDENFADAHLGIGVILEERGDNEQALASYRKAIEVNPDSAQAYRELTEVLLRTGKAEEALAVARECVRRFPTVCEHHFWVGQALLELGEYEEAYRAHKEAIQLNPDFPLSYFPLARICARLGKRDEAAQYRERFTALRTPEMQADRNRSKAYDDLAAQTHAVVKRHVLAGSLHLQYGDLRVAEAHWLRAAAIDPDDCATRKSLALLYERQHRAGAELQFLDQLIHLEPDNPEHPLRKGRLLIDMHRWPEAETVLAGVIEIQPESADAHLVLAEMHFKNGSNRPALTHAEKAMSLAPSSRGFLLLAAIRNECGDRPGAISALRRAMSLDPDNPEIRRTYEQLLATD